MQSLLEEAAAHEQQENSVKEKRRVVVSGLVSSLREVITKKGTRMAFGQIEDLTGQMEIILFPDSFAKFEAVIKSDKALLMGGFFEKEAGSGKIILDTATTLEDIFLKARKITFHLDRLDMEDFPNLEKILKKYSGSVPLVLEMSLGEMNRKVQIESETLKGVQLSTQLLEALRSEFKTADFFEIQVGSS